MTALPLVFTLFRPMVALPAQLADTSVQVTVGFGVDTTGAPGHEIFALWRNYLSVDRTARNGAPCGRPPNKRDGPSQICFAVTCTRDSGNSPWCTWPRQSDSTART